MTLETQVLRIRGRVSGGDNLCVIDNEGVVLRDRAQAECSLKFEDLRPVLGTGQPQEGVFDQRASVPSQHDAFMLYISCAIYRRDTQQPYYKEHMEARALDKELKGNAISGTNAFFTT